MFERNAHTCYIPCFFYASDLLTILKFISIIPPRYIFMMTILYHISVSHGTQCSLLSTPWENFLTIFTFFLIFLLQEHQLCFQSLYLYDIILFAYYFIMFVYIIILYFIMFVYTIVYIVMIISKPFNVAFNSIFSFFLPFFLELSMLILVLI